MNLTQNFVFQTVLGVSCKVKVTCHLTMNDRGKIKSDEIEAVGKAWPEYRIWVAYGDELPEAGQISPMTKKAQEDLVAAGKASY